MNIFVVDYDPVIAGKSLCDKHTIKMVLESTQLLCSAARINGGNAPYQITHKNHPATKWVAQSYSNYLWLLRHTESLLEEYTKRYNKTHKCQEILPLIEVRTFPEIGLTPFVKCMPDKYKQDDVVLSYRNYYINEKTKFAKWKNTNPPDWFLAGSCNGSWKP